jgi:endonuclease/exonuclease/phosphatase family metal-dependent hydrolase
MRWTVQALEQRQIDIVGMQELEPGQESTFMDVTGGAWDHFPDSHGKAGAANVVAWRTDQWAAVAAARQPVPYFHGHPVQMPYVLLENPSGLRVWIISVHNPADTRGPAQRWRDQAVQAEAQLIAELAADGTPVLLTGDMNDRERFFCAITEAGTVHAANSSATGSPCRPPPSMAIDWIVSTTDLTFTNYTETRRPPINRASDHPLVFADLSLN